MNNLFSIFDPYSTPGGFGPFPVNWASSCLILFLLPRGFWVQQSGLIVSLSSVLTSLRAEIRSVLRSSSPPGTPLALFSLFVFIVGSNTLGLLPYVFTASSHLRFTISLALPLWGGCILWSIVFQANRLLCHLVPVGTPPPLIPVIVIIETVRNLIRPGALAVRLAANMVAGHLLLSLLGGQGTRAAAAGVLIGLFFLIILECAVACIQSYVFTILSTLYMNDLIRVTFNSSMVK